MLAELRDINKPALAIGTTANALDALPRLKLSIDIICRISLDERGCVRAVLLGFALGVWALQQPAVLPAVWLCLLSCLIALTGAVYVRRRLMFVVAACVFGFSYGSLRAYIRLAAHLPLAYEQRNIELSGFVRSLPEPGEHGTRFHTARAFTRHALSFRSRIEWRGVERLRASCDCSGSRLWVWKQASAGRCKHASNARMAKRTSISAIWKWRCSNAESARRGRFRRDAVCRMTRLVLR